MFIDELYSIALIIILVVFSIGIGLLTQRRKPLMDASESLLEDTRLAAARVDKDLQVNVIFSEGAMQHPWDPAEKSLLDFVESHGIDVECQCRAGECGSCRTRLISGDVEYLQEPSIKPGRGYCLLCVSIPKSDVTLVI